MGVGAGPWGWALGLGVSRDPGPVDLNEAGDERQPFLVVIVLKINDVMTWHEMCGCAALALIGTSGEDDAYEW